ncbi:MAG: SCO family protein [Planctomycetaceae bacterium]|nr:SCO family protein [Planctomycetaceae bacterium]
MKLYIGTITIVMVCISGLSNPLMAQPEREILNEAIITPHVGNELPLDAQFVRYSGEPIALGNILNDERPVVLCLVYFDCPMLCKLAASGLVKTVSSLDENVGVDFDVVFVSFNPLDTPEKAASARNQALRNYARDESGRGWYFLTGEQPAINQLTESVGFHYIWDNETKQFSHAAGLTVISPDGVITEYLDGVRFSPAELRTAIERADRGELVESPAVTFARCYLYDPTTGKFGSLVQWTIRILGGLTVAFIAVAVYRLNRRSSISEQSQPSS